jgi:hypothetical protein
MVSSNDLKKLESSINEDLRKASLSVKIEIKKYSSTPTEALEHSLHYLNTLSKEAHLKLYEVIEKHYTKWRKELGMST